METLLAAPPVRPLATDVKAVLRLTRWLPALNTMPVPLARALYTGAAFILNPLPRGLASITRPAPNLTLFQPKTVQPGAGVHLFLHGGGWVLGSPRSYRSYCAWLAVRTQSPVYSLDYRRAPEHPYPAALNDCVQAFAELRHRLAPTGPIHVVGDSAGAALSLGLCHRLRASGERSADTLLLYYPVVEAPGETGSYQDFGEGLLLTRGMMHWFWQLYQAPRERDELFPLRWPSPDWLPPVSLCLARHDVLFDEGFRLAEALRAAGVLQNVQVETDLPHGFLNLMHCPTAMAALERSVHSKDLADALTKRNSDDAEHSHGPGSLALDRSRLALSLSDAD